MFAIALWDAARAPAGPGARPLRDQAALLRGGADGTLAFASELKALLRQPGFSREVDPRRARGVPRVQLDPGAADDLPRRRASCRRATCSSATAASRDDRALRAPAPAPRAERAAARRADALADELRERLRDSVRAHLVADVPVGVLLSGGVDSVGARGARRAARAARRCRRSRSASRSARSTSSTQRAARREPLRHRPPRAGRRPGRGRAAAAVAEAFDEPFADSSALPDLPRLASSPPSTSRWCSPARAATSSSAATTPTSPTCSPRASAGSRALARPLVERLPSSSGGAARLQGQALRARRAPAAARAPPRAGRRSSRRDARARAAPRRARASDPLDVYARATPRPRAPSRSRACRTSTWASISSTTCSSRPTA